MYTTAVPSAAAAANMLEKEIDRLFAERCRRLVQDQQLRGHGQGLGNFQEVLVGDAERAGPIIEVHVHAHLVQHCPQRSFFVARKCEVLGRNRQPDVLGDRHVGSKAGC